MALSAPGAGRAGSHAKPIRDRRDRQGLPDQGPISSKAAVRFNGRVMPTAPPLIAVVDDEESVRKALRRLLSASGLTVRTFAGGADFLLSMGDQRPQCLVLDLHMPGVTGLDVLHYLAEQGPPIPTIVITAHDEPESRTQCIAAGAIAYLSKPLDESALLEVIGRTAKDKAA